MTLSIFSCLCWSSVCLLWRNVYLWFLPPPFFLDTELFVYFVYILKINSLLVVSFADIFSHSEDFLFILAMVFLWASRVTLVVKNLPANAGDVRDSVLVSGLERPPWVGNGTPLKYLCLENSMAVEPGRL